MHERLLFWLQKDYILGMGLFLLFTLFFSNFSLMMDYYALIRITLGLKIGKEISYEYHFKQLFQKNVRNSPYLLFNNLRV
ncbi:hypothetical protein [Spiroplasma citri]|nr:hypothetical protein [Spiroplasma citri]WFG98311.1 hypothetical protein M1770_09800 [Spiroplasma citri]WFH00251.1 hypothetical protein M1771_09820 [Spiroplasma citri]